MNCTMKWASAGMLALAAATALAQDKQGSVGRLEQSIERLEKSVERLERAISRLEPRSSERGSMGGMMGDGGMMGGGMMGRSRPNEQWRTPGNSR
jgi:hypothetical protein